MLEPQRLARLYELAEGRGFAPGTVRKWADGFYVKRPDGEWTPVSIGRRPSTRPRPRPDGSLNREKRAREVKRGECPPGWADITDQIPGGHNLDPDKGPWQAYNDDGVEGFLDAISYNASQDRSLSDEDRERLDALLDRIKDVRITAVPDAGLLSNSRSSICARFAKKRLGRW